MSNIDIGTTFEVQNLVPIEEIVRKLSTYISQKVRIILDEGVSWKKKVFDGVLERVGYEGIRIRTLANKILDIPYRETGEGDSKSPGIKEIRAGKNPVYHKVPIRYTL